MTSRRDVLKSVALGGAAAGVTACAPQDGGAGDHTGGITQRTIAEAEKLQGVKFTREERAMMIEGLEANLENLARLRSIETPNVLAPAQIFDPQLPRKKVPSQKNTLRPGGDYVAEFPGDTPESAADIAFASIGQLGVWLRAGALTSVRLTEIYLERIEQYGPRLECFITVTADIALEQAQKADKDFAAGRDKGPLHGIPYGLKDLADTEDIRTTWGATPYQERTPKEDADIVRKLKRAGAVMLGKTTCGAIAYGDQWFAGKTRNPWNPNEGSSGSSAGSASATAAGLCAFSIGTETLGSIVSPSERCGVTGLRPTFGRVSRAGFMNLCWSLDKVGPICRTVEDCAFVLSEINGFDIDDPGTARKGFTYDGKMDLGSLKIGYVPSWFEEGDDVDRAGLEALRGLGLTLEEFEWPEIDFRSLIQIVLVESAAAFSDLTLQNIDDTLVWQGSDAWPNTWRQARFVSAVDYVQIDRIRRQLMIDLNEAFDGFDALIGPHFSAGALLATNCTGHPQLALRAGYAATTTRDNATAPNIVAGETFKTPRGLSLWADIFQEGKLLAVGRALEAALGVAAERPPGFN